MTFFRNRMFLQGIALGGLFGIIIGSIIAFTIGESSVEAIRRVPWPQGSAIQVPFSIIESGVSLQ